MTYNYIDNGGNEEDWVGGRSLKCLCFVLLLHARKSSTNIKLKTGLRLNVAHKIDAN